MRIAAAIFIALLSLAQFSVKAAAQEKPVKKESAGKNLYIYAALPQKSAEELVKRFNSVYPEIRVDFVRMGDGEILFKHMNDLAGRKVTADILWGRDIASLAAIVKDGYALPYKPSVPDGVIPQAFLGGSAVATGFEPVVFVYNKKLIDKKDLPASRKLLLKALEKKEWQGKLAVCDPEKNHLARLLLTQDLAYFPDFWGMVKKFGAAGIRIYPDHQSILDKVARGEVLAGYNLPLSAVLRSLTPDSQIGWILLSDYNLAMPQIALITKAATNPEAARLWIDFILSSRAQPLLTAETDLLPVLSGSEAGAMAKSAGDIPPKIIKMIGVGSEVTRFNDEGLRKGFLIRWKEKLGGK